MSMLLYERVELQPGEVTKFFLGTGEKRETPGSKWSTALKRDPCAYCGRVSYYRPTKKQRRRGMHFDHMATIDHILPRPVSRGWSNQTGSCAHCNQAKADTPLLLFLLQRNSETTLDLSGPPSRSL